MKKLYLLLALLVILSGTSWAGEENRVQVQELAKASQSWDGQTLPQYPDGKPEITVLRITVSPGVKLPLHMHPVINAGVLLQGELTVVTEQNDILHLKAGEAIIEVVDTWHYGVNEGEQPAVIIVFYAGTTKSPITISK